MPTRSLFMADTKELAGFLPFGGMEKAQKADFDCPGDFSSLKQMSDSNPHYAQFDSFKNKKVYRMP
jgi:iron complex transport system substrate-binding protein